MVVSSQPMYNGPQTPNSRYHPPVPFQPLPPFEMHPNIPPWSPAHMVDAERRDSRSTDRSASAAFSTPSFPITRSDHPGAIVHGATSSAPEQSGDRLEKEKLQHDPAAEKESASVSILKSPFYPTVSVHLTDTRGRSANLLQLPWYSANTSPSTFPTRDTSTRKRIHTSIPTDGVVSLPARQVPSAASQSSSDQAQHAKSSDDAGSEISTLAAPSDAETPATSHAPSESECTTPTTPAPIQDSSPKPTPTQAPRRDPRAVVAVPFIPGLPRHKPATPSLDRRSPSVHTTGEATVTAAIAPVSDEDKVSEQEQETVAPVKPAPPKSWADLVRKKDAPGRAAAPLQPTNGIASVQANATLAEALRQYVVQPGHVAFFEPRGLVNTGNMCYMNSVSHVNHSSAIFANQLVDLANSSLLRTLLRLPRSSEDENYTLD